MVKHLVNGLLKNYIKHQLHIKLENEEVSHRKMKILNFGSLNIDKVYKVETIVNKSETLSADGFKENIGGKGLNQSIALKRAGMDLYHAGAIGTDGDYLKEILTSEGINTDYVKELTGVSGHAVIQLDYSGNNSIIVYGGANSKISHEYIDQTLSHFTEGDVILLQNEISNVDYIIKRAYEKGLKVFFNPSPVNKKLKTFPIDYVDYLLLNEIEGEALTGKSDPEEILDDLQDMYPKAKIVLTLGENGSVYSFEQERLYQAASPVEVKDTSGAGDTFTGYFIASVLNNKSVKEALELSSLAGALATSRYGTSVSIPNIVEVEQFKKERIEENKK